VHLLVNSADELPLFRQIVRQIIDAIAAGRLKSGDQLPSHRELSEQLVIAPLTVKRAYDELEAAGYIETQRGRGTFVRSRLPVVDRKNQREEIARTAQRLLSESYLAGLSFPDVVRMLEEADRRFRKKE
jgi:GntR family transcriptional regulator